MGRVEGITNDWEFSHCDSTQLTRDPFSQQTRFMTRAAPAQTSTTGAPSQPTHTRYWVIAFAIILAVIQYIDRVCISQAMPDIARDLKLTDTQKGAIYSAFGLAYALFEIPTGWLGDKIGPRRVLVRVVLWWSFFTAATGWMWNHI